MDRVHDLEAVLELVPGDIELPKLFEARDGTGKHGVADLVVAQVEVFQVSADADSLHTLQLVTTQIECLQGVSDLLKLRRVERDELIIFQ